MTVYDKMTKCNDGVFDYFLVTVLDEEGNRKNLRINESTWRVISKSSSSHHAIHTKADIAKYHVDSLDSINKRLSHQSRARLACHYLGSEGRITGESVAYICDHMVSRCTDMVGLRVAVYRLIISYEAGKRSKLLRMFLTKDGSILGRLMLAIRVFRGK